MVSPDPQADAGTQFMFDANGNLMLGDDLRWMTDFDEAVNRGMGFRVALTREHAGGFDRLVRPRPALVGRCGTLRKASSRPC